MIVLEGSWEGWDVPGPTAVTIGVYDGIHRGHQAVIEATRAAADGHAVAVLTFDGHPLTLSAPDHAPRLLTTRVQKLELLEATGVDVTALLRFDENLRHMSPERFIDDVIVGTMKARTVVVGDDFRFGYKRRGDVGLLRRRSGDLGYDVVGVGLHGNAEPVSSTAVRRRLEAGDVEGAAALLGRRFELMGTVVPGDRRGRSIGFPTANVAISSRILLPMQGVYAVHVLRGAELLPGVVNIGVRPTFGPGRETVEAYILDFDDDLYGEELRIRFVGRIRGEQRFDGIDDLVRQIDADVAEARRMLTDASPDPASF